jgi:CubicO group peptidase (beta-lactamase class C family)
MSPVAIEGTVAPGFEPVADAFRAAFEVADTGAALAVRRRGEVVVDLWGGVADPVRGTPWTRDTHTTVFSCTKGLMSILAARAVAAGLLDYERPVAAYWPEFAQAGKAATRVRDLLAHRAGLSAPREAVDLATALEWDAMTRLLAEQEPLWEPGSGHAYHALTHGWLVGELLRRVTGLPPGELLARELAEPLGAQVLLGVPQDASIEISDSIVGAGLARLTREQAEARRAGEIDWPNRAMTLGDAFPPELVAPGEGFNAPAVRAALIPGAGGIATARGLAAVWSATVVETDGVRLLDDETVTRGIEVVSQGEPVFAVPPPWSRWGMGFQLDSEARRYLGPTSFGHDGAGGQVAFADRAHEVGFAFVTNRMEAIDDHRATRVVDALRAVLTSSGSAGGAGSLALSRWR